MYSPAGDEVLLKSRIEGEVIHIFIQDHGIGIPLDKLETVFESYTRIEAANTHYIGGTGLGLAIVRQIVEIHGGKTWAESSQGKGTIFHITLPIVKTLIPV